MSRFYDAMVRKQQAEAEQGGAQTTASRNTARVSILPIPEPTSAPQEVSPDEQATPAAEDRGNAPRIERIEDGTDGLEERPRDTDRAAPQVGRSDIHPAYERIIQRLLAHRRAKRENVYLVVSAVAGEGASTVARNLASAIGDEQSERVVLVDANLRTPSQHDAFDLPREEGLVDVLSGAISLTDGISTVQTTGLAVLTSGTPVSYTHLTLPTTDVVCRYQCSTYD